MPSQPVDKGVDRSGKDASKLSKEQAAVLHMITEEFLTPEQIRIARQTSRQAVHKIIRKLREKGLLGKGLTKGLTKSTPLRAPTAIKAGMIRLHGQQWRAEFVYKSERYDVLRERGNLLFIDGNTVELNKDCIEVYGATDDESNSSLGFFGEDVTRATFISFDYWNRFFTRLESELGVVLVKPRANNRKLVHQGHYAEVGNALAKDYNEKNIKLHVYAGDDGKLRFLIDNSFNLEELEAVRSHSSRQDMERVKAVFNEIADGGMLPSQIAQLMREQAINVKEISAALNVLVKLSTPQDAQRPEPAVDKVSVRPDYVG